MKVAALVAAAATAAALLSAPTAAASKPDPVTDGVHVIGDSIAFQVHRDTELSAAPANWTVDAFPGRRLTALRTRMVDETRDYDVAVKHVFKIKRKTRISTLVLALGTNGADSVMTVDQVARMLTRAVTRLRGLPIWKHSNRRVILVTPYVAPRIRQGATDPATGQPYPRRHWADKGAVYARAMSRLDHADVGVCVMPWRAVAQRRPSLVSADGVHPTQEGLEVWRSLLLDTVKKCSLRQAVQLSN